MSKGGMKQPLRPGHHGFSLVELLVTVIVVGILAAAAIPNYMKAMERSYFQEAESILLAIYSGERAYLLVNEFYYDVNEAGGMAEWRKINIDDPNLPSIPVSYNVNTCAAPPCFTFTATATRPGGPCGGSTRTINDNRALTGGSCWCGAC